MRGKEMGMGEGQDFKFAHPVKAADTKEEGTSQPPESQTVETKDARRKEAGGDVWVSYNLINNWLANLKKLRDKQAPVSEIAHWEAELDSSVKELLAKLDVLAGVVIESDESCSLEIDKLSYIAKQGIDELKEKVIQVLQKIIDELEPGMETGQDLYTGKYDTYIAALELSVELSADDSIIQKAKHILFEVPGQEEIDDKIFSRYGEHYAQMERTLIVKLIGKSDRDNAKDVLDKTVDYDDETKVEIISRVLEPGSGFWIKDVQKHLDSLPLPSDFKLAEYVPIWVRSSDNPNSAIKSNLRTVMEITKEKPEAVAVLTEQFGIKDFARYDAKVLLRQYEQRDNDQDPYGVVVFPEDDHNGAFYSDRKIITHMSDSLAGSFNLRIVEANSKIGVVKQMLQLRKKYPNHKFSFALIGGHGTKDSIQFGDGYYRPRHISHLTVEDLNGPGSGRAAGFFENSATIMLASCSTGQNEGIAQKISKKLGVQVIAPDIPTGIKAIDVGVVDGRPNFMVTYWDKESLQSYSAGEKK